MERLEDRLWERYERLELPPVSQTVLDATGVSHGGYWRVAPCQKRTVCRIAAQASSNGRQCKFYAFRPAKRLRRLLAAAVEASAAAKGQTAAPSSSGSAIMASLPRNVKKLGGTPLSPEAALAFTLAVCGQHPVSAVVRQVRDPHVACRYTASSHALGAFATRELMKGEVIGVLGGVIMSDLEHQVFPCCCS